MTTEITPGSRVRVTVSHMGYHRRNFYGKVLNWTASGLIRVLEDGGTARNYSSDNVKLIKT